MRWKRRVRRAYTQGRAAARVAEAEWNEIGRLRAGKVRVAKRPPRGRSLKPPATQPAFVFLHEKAVAVAQLVVLASLSILHPSCRSLADAGATRSRRVFSSLSWLSVCPFALDSPCQRARTPSFIRVARSYPYSRMRLTRVWLHRCIWHWPYDLREHALRV